MKVKVFRREREWFRSLSSEDKDKVIDFYEEAISVDDTFSCFWDFIRRRAGDIERLLSEKGG